MEKKATKKAAPVKKAAAKKVSTKETVKKAPVKKPVQAKEPAKPATEAKKPRKKVEAEPVVQAPIVQPKKVVETAKKVAVAAPEVVAVKSAPVQAPKPVVVEPKPVNAPQAAPKRVAPRKGTALIAHGVGRRKCAVARVWLRLGSGKMVINDREFLNYFPTEITQLSAGRPFDIIANAQHYDVVANVLGGGYCAQAEAVGLGFARALLQLNESWRPELRKAGLLTVDSRQKERKKYGQKRARRKFQFVKR